MQKYDLLLVFVLTSSSVTATESLTIL